MPRTALALKLAIWSPLAAFCCLFLVLALDLVWGNAPQALASFATPDGGLRHLTSEDEPSLLSTVRAMPALAGKPLPVASGCTGDDAPESDGCLPLAPAA